MRKSTRLAAKQPKPVNQAQREPKSKKKRSENRITNIASMDNGTTLETFKYLNYSQLAKARLVSRRFSNLIRTHRHSLALLFVDQIYMNNDGFSYATYPFAAKIFNKRLSPDAYNKWILSNNYSQHVSLEDKIPRKLERKHTTSKESTQNDYHTYELNAYAFYKDPNRRRPTDRTAVFSARMKIDSETWPLLQHFVRLLTDRFIYIRHLELISRMELLNLLTESVNSERGRLQCKEMHFYLEDNVKKFMNWFKYSAHCDEFHIYDHSGLDKNEEMLNFCVTGAFCTSAVDIRYCEHSNITVDLVQKFIKLKNCDEYQLVDSIRYNSENQLIEVLKCNYAKHILTVEKDNVNTAQTFEFVNKDIRKKLHLTTRMFNDDQDDITDTGFRDPSDSKISMSMKFENL